MNSTPSALVLDEITSQHPPLENPRRNGKIARLPKPTRELINRMLDDGLPYRVIIDELGDAGSGLNAQNLTNWVQGGYQDYLHHQELIERAKAQLEFAADLLRETACPNPALLSRAIHLIAGTQMMTAIMQHGEHALAAMLRSNPAAFLTMINTLCNMTDSTIKLETYRLAVAQLTAFEPASSNSQPDPQAPLTFDSSFAQPAPKGPIFKPNQGDSRRAK